MNWKPGFKSLLFHIQLVPLHGGELRNLCVQQRAEEAVGRSDLSPAAMFGIDSALRPVLTSLAKLLGNMGGAVCSFE
jgi:hypothetical protein